MPTNSEKDTKMPDLPEFSSDWPSSEVPLQREVTPENRDVIVAGCLDWVSQHIGPEFEEGAEALKLASLVGRLLDCGTSSEEWIEKAKCAGWCEAGDQPGDAPLETLIRLLVSQNVSMNIEFGESIEDLAVEVEQGSVVLAGVNTGILLDQPGSVGDGSNNSLVAVVGVARNAESAVPEGFIVLPRTSAAPHLVSATAINLGWLDTGGVMAVSESSMPNPNQPEA
jgi:hypothetical protein